MSATHALPGEVIEVREWLPALRAAEISEGEVDPPEKELPPGLYALVGQRGTRLFVAAVAEDDNRQIRIVGPLFVLPVAVLEARSVGVTYLRVKKPDGVLGQTEETT